MNNKPTSSSSNPEVMDPTLRGNGRGQGNAKEALIPGSKTNTEITTPPDIDQFMDTDETKIALQLDKSLTVHAEPVLPAVCIDYIIGKSYIQLPKGHNNQLLLQHIGILTRRPNDGKFSYHVTSDIAFPSSGRIKIIHPDETEPERRIQYACITTDSQNIFLIPVSHTIGDNGLRDMKQYIIPKSNILTIGPPQEKVFEVTTLAANLKKAISNKRTRDETETLNNDTTNKISKKNTDPPAIRTNRKQTNEQQALQAKEKIQQHQKRQEEEKNKEPPRPPPIIIDGIIENFTKLKEELLSKYPKGDVSLKMGTGRIKKIQILTKNKTQHEQILEYCRQQLLSGHTYRPKDTREFEVVIRGLPRTIETSEIKEELEIHNITTKHISSIWKGGKPMNAFKVRLEDTPPNQKIWDTRQLCYHAVHIEEPYAKGFAICTACSQYGHTEKYCLPGEAMICPACSGPHPLRACPNKETPVCARCKETGHAATFRGCEKYRKYERARLGHKEESPQQQSQLTGEARTASFTPKTWGNSQEPRHTEQPQNLQHKEQNFSKQQEHQPQYQNNNKMDELISIMMKNNEEQNKRMNQMIEMMSNLMALLTKVLAKQL